MHVDAGFGRFQCFYPHICMVFTSCRIRMWLFLMQVMQLCRQCWECICFTCLRWRRLWYLTICNNSDRNVMVDFYSIPNSYVPAMLYSSPCCCYNCSRISMTVFRGIERRWMLIVVTIEVRMSICGCKLYYPCSLPRELVTYHDSVSPD